MPDLSTVVNMFFGADNNKVLYALIILVTSADRAGLPDAQFIPLKFFGV